MERYSNPDSGHAYILLRVYNLRDTPFMRILANPRSNSSLRWTGPVDGYYRVQTVSQDPGIDILLGFAVPAGEGYQGG
jgi:hypothetical protein